MGAQPGTALGVNHLCVESPSIGLIQHLSMNPAITLTQKQLTDFLLNVAVVRPVHLGAPGIGKSALVQRLAAEVGMESGKE